MKAPKQMTVDTEGEGLRLDQYLTAHAGLALSRSQIQKLVHEGKVSVDGETAVVKLLMRPGMRIVVQVPELRVTRLKAEKIPLDILFEDKEFLIVNKPAGLVVHPGAGNPDGTLANALVHHLGAKIQALFGAERPGIVHRLDKDTSGCLAVAKTERAFKSLSAQIASHKAGRTYVALAWGRFEEDSGLIDAPLGRSRTDRRKFAVRLERGKEARTQFKVIERMQHACYLELKLETGRTHQIRAHLLSINRPIINDPDYGSLPTSTKPSLRDALKKVLKRQALHAWKLELSHPVTHKPVRVLAKVPKDILAALEILRNPPRI